MKVGRITASLALVLALGATAPMVENKTPMQRADACRAIPPAEAKLRPARWLGACPNGVAQGIGVMRFGTTEPFEFFFGEMHKNVPVRGLFKLNGGWGAARQFDAAHNAVNPRSWDPQDFHNLYVLAERSARATAQRFKSTGNWASFAYYERLANEIRDGEPE